MPHEGRVKADVNVPEVRCNYILSSIFLAAFSGFISGFSVKFDFFCFTITKLKRRWPAINFLINFILEHLCSSLRTQ